MKYKKIIDLHKKLARRVKQYETAQDLLPPAEVLNEMRYALRAVVEILELESASASSDDINHAIQKGYHALLCAYHDLVDGLVIHLSVLLEELADEYLVETITVLGPKRAEIIDFVNEVNDKIILSREEPSQRHKVYEEDLYDKYFDQLLEYRKALTGSIIEDIVALHERKKDEKEKQRVKYAVATGLAVISIIVTIMLS